MLLAMEATPFAGGSQPITEKPIRARPIMSRVIFDISNNRNLRQLSLLQHSTATAHTTT